MMDLLLSTTHKIAIYTTLLYRLLGPSVLWGFGILLGQIPLNIFGLRILNRLSKKQNEAKDARTKRTTEAISNIKLLKIQVGNMREKVDIIRYMSQP